MFSLLGQPRAGAIVAAITSVVIAGPACAQEREQRITFNISAQSLSAALIEFSRQSDVMVVVDPGLVNGRAAPAVQGQFTAHEALTHLLAGSGISPTQQPDGGFVLAGSPIQLGDATAAASSEEEIVVTARRREELVQDVPASVTAIGGAALDHIGAEGFEDFVRLVPGLTMNPTSTNPNFSIRGVSTSTTLGTTQQPIALYVDDTPTQDPFVALSSLNLYLSDISRVEVLRGPQGTLFGSGSLSGAIRVITRAPDPSEFAGYIEGGVSTIEGGDPGTHLEGMINAPLGDSTALRAVVYSRHVGGYIDNPTRGVDDVNDYSVEGGRVALRTEFTPNFSLTGSIIHQRDEGEDGARTFYTSSQGGSDEWSSLQADDTQFETTIGNVLVNYDLGWATLTSSTSHLVREEHTHLDASPDLAPLLGVAGTPVFSDNDNDSENTVQEFRLTSDGHGPLSYVLGAYYSNAQRHTHTFVRVPALEAALTIPYALQADLQTEIQETALFGELTWAVSDTVELAAGVRVFRNEVDLTVDNDGLLIGPPVQLDRTNIEESATPRFTITWEPSDDLTLYAQAAKGYRLGQANVAAGPPIYESDTLWNYEIGFKGQFFDRRLQLNVAAFDIEWDNLQVGLRIPSTVLLYTGNAGAARSVGLEIESVYRVTDNLDFSTSLAFTDAELTESIPDLPQPSGVLGVTEGERLPGTPQFTMSNAIAYTRALSDDTMLRLRLDHQYVGRSYNAFTAASALEMGDFSVVNFSGGIDFNDTRIDLFVKNIGNSDGVTNANFDLGLDTIRAAWRVPPRSVGIVVRQSF